MKPAACLRLAGAAAALAASSAFSAATTLSFEGAGAGPDRVWGTRGTVAFPLYSGAGFDIDVFPSGAPNPAMHWHETNSLANDKVPDRPAVSAGVLWRDARAGQDPLVFVATGSLFDFALDSLVVGASTADGSQTTALELRGFMGPTLLGTVSLATPANSYAAVSGASLGALQGLFLDRLEIVGLSSSAFAYYMLDDVGFSTRPIPEPASYALMALGLGVIVLRARLRGG